MWTQFVNIVFQAFARHNIMFFLISHIFHVDKCYKLLHTKFSVDFWIKAVIIKI